MPATGAQGPARLDRAADAAGLESRTRPASAPSTSRIRTGNPLEILQFPPGKGAAAMAGGDRLFLGIDHTAIVVADTAASLALYRDRLGLQVAGESENYGTEQEHLNNVFGAHLRITTLRAASGPGIELLEYLAPDRRATGAGRHAANDLWHAQVGLVATEIAAAADALGGGGVALGVLKPALPRDPADERFGWRDARELMISDD